MCELNLFRHKLCLDRTLFGKTRKRIQEHWSKEKASRQSRVISNPSNLYKGIKGDPTQSVNELHLERDRSTAPSSAPDSPEKAKLPNLLVRASSSPQLRTDLAPLSSNPFLGQSSSTPISRLPSRKSSLDVFHDVPELPALPAPTNGCSMAELNFGDTTSDDVTPEMSEWDEREVTITEADKMAEMAQRYYPQEVIEIGDVSGMRPLLGMEVGAWKLTP